MYKQRIFTGILLVVVLVISVCPVSTQQPEQTDTAKFVLAEWDYPDEYGQGIYGFRFYENSTGSWVAAPWYNDIGSFYFLHDYDAIFHEWQEPDIQRLLKKDQDAHRRRSGDPPPCQEA